jgi:hypothetical protein
MRTLNIRAVIITDGEKYFIHGTDNETSADLFKRMLPIWNMDPATETAHYVEIPVTLPEYEDQVTNHANTDDQ